MAILFCGLVMSHYTHYNLSPVTQVGSSSKVTTVTTTKEEYVVVVVSVVVVSLVVVTELDELDIKPNVVCCSVVWVFGAELELELEKAVVVCILSPEELEERNCCLLDDSLL